MRNDWRLYTTHEGISSIRNTELDEKNYYRMKVFMKNSAVIRNLIFLPLLMLADSLKVESPGSTV